MSMTFGRIMTSSPTVGAIDGEAQLQNLRKLHYGLIDIQRDKETKRQRDKETKRQRDKETKRQRDKFEEPQHHVQDQWFIIECRL